MFPAAFGYAIGFVGNIAVPYILIAIRLEEHDLTATLGAQYRQYRRGVPMLIPRPRRRAPRPREVESGVTA